MKALHDFPKDNQHWMVYTPDYIKYPGNLWGDNPEPPEYGADVVFVQAFTKKQALVAGVRELRRVESGWLDEASNPFTKLKTQIAICKHGFCWCEIETCIKKEDYCSECEKEDMEDVGSIW